MLARHKSARGREAAWPQRHTPPTSTAAMAMRRQKAKEKQTVPELSQLLDARDSAALLEHERDFLTRVRLDAEPHHARRHGRCRYLGGQSLALRLGHLHHGGYRAASAASLACAATRGDKAGQAGASGEQAGPAGLGPAAAVPDAVGTLCTRITVRNTATSETKRATLSHLGTHRHTSHDISAQHVQHQCEA